MKTWITLLLSAGMVLSNFLSQAQFINGAIEYPELAHLFSNYQYRGSARLMGAGGAQISLGGDISVALSNPAGLGFYNRSEITITPAFAMKGTDAGYLGTNTDNAFNKFHIGNLGAVFNKSRDDFQPGAWRGGSFAISYSRVNDFSNQVVYQGENTLNDILDFYVTDANVQDVDPDDLRGFTRGAYDLYLMSEFVDIFSNGDNRLFYDRTFFAEIPDENFPTVQREVIDTEGTQNQWTFAYGGNFSDKIYVGASLGIMSLRYDVSKSYEELYPALNEDVVLRMSTLEDLQVTGTGVNGTFGIIARPIDILTVGFSVITPTLFNVSEQFLSQMEAQYQTFDMADYGDYFDANYEIILNSRPADVEEVGFLDDPNPPTLDDEFTGDIEPSVFEYKITTPVRLNAGATIFINKNGFISADIEWVDYSKSKLDADGSALEEYNAITKDLYKSVLNYRIGAEWRYKKFRLRGGFAYLPDPYRQSNESSRNRMNLTGGLGFRSGKFYTDLAVISSTTKSDYAPYIFDPAVEGSAEYLQTNYAKLDQHNLNMLLTLGLFF
jgi:hypothetical protein